MKSVVITGSTRGIGYGMAQAFLARDCAVMVCGRSHDSVRRALERLSQPSSAHVIRGQACDVREADQVERLWQAAKSAFGKVDIWINNAGLGLPQYKLWEASAEQARQMVETNLLGVIYGSQVAARGMAEQGFGGIYNMEGAGSDGRLHDGLILYGMTKYGVAYFTRGLIQELSKTAILVGSIRPGMVITDLITGQFADRTQDWERAKRIFNIIADRVETVTPWLADRILENSKHGAQISWTSRRKMLFRFLTAPFSRRNIFEDPGV